MSFWALYSVLFVLAFGGFFAIKYGIKGLAKAGVFDDDFETRYTPATKTTHIAHAILMGVLGLVLLAIVI